MKKYLKLLLVLLCLLLVLVGVSKLGGKETVNEDPIVENEISEVIEDKDLYKEQIDKVNEYVSINDDFIGLLNLGKDLVVDEVVVKDADNNEYIHKDFYTKEYSIYGTTFMDYRNTDNFDYTQNVCVYGHFVYPEKWDGIHINFTNLKELIDKENYEENKNATFITRDGIREYEVASVYYIDENDIYEGKGPLYYITDFTEEEFETYLDEVANAEFYKTGVELEYEDKLLTLQTCVENRKELRLIVVLKEVNRVYFE